MQILQKSQMINLEQNNNRNKMRSEAGLLVEIFDMIEKLIIQAHKIIKDLFFSFKVKI